MYFDDEVNCYVEEDNGVEFTDGKDVYIVYWAAEAYVDINGHREPNRNAYDYGDTIEDGKIDRLHYLSVAAYKNDETWVDETPSVIFYQTAGNFDSYKIDENSWDEETKNLWDNLKTVKGGTSIKKYIDDDVIESVGKWYEHDGAGDLSKEYGWYSDEWWKP